MSHKKQTNLAGLGGFAGVLKLSFPVFGSGDLNDPKPVFTIKHNTHTHTQKKN